MLDPRIKSGNFFVDHLIFGDITRLSTQHFQTGTLKSAQGNQTPFEQRQKSQPLHQE